MVTESGQIELASAAIASDESPGLSELRGPVSGATHLKHFVGSRGMLIAIFAASVVVTLGFWRVLPDGFRANEQSDYPAYYKPVAENILAGRGISRDNENPATAYPPGYSLLLAAIFELSSWTGVSEEFGLSVFGAVGMALTCGFIFVLARGLFGPVAALLSSLAWMTYPFALWLTKQPNSEIPFMVLFFGGLTLFWYAMARQKTTHWFLSCGVIFGLGMLVRPIIIGIAIVLSIVIWYGRKELRPRARAFLIAMLLLGNIAAVAPWEAFVYQRTGKVIPLSTNGVKGIRDGLTYGIDTKGYREVTGVSPDVSLVMRDIMGQIDQITDVRKLAIVMGHEFRSYPGAVTKLLLLKIARSWYATDSRRSELPILLIQIVYLGLLSWGAWRCWKLGGIHRTFVAGTLLVVFYFWGMTVLVLSILRYMIPAMGLLFVLIGARHPRSKFGVTLLGDFKDAG